MNKRGISPVVGYVILIAIILIISLITYNWIKTYKLGGGLECPEGVSLVIEKAECSNHKLEVKVKNNGLFDINGYVIRGERKISETKKEVIDLYGGYYYFDDFEDIKLEPDEDITKLFGGTKAGRIMSVEITPIRFEQNEKGDKTITICTNAITKKSLGLGCEIDGSETVENPKCDEVHFYLCDESECKEIEGYWWSDEKCHEEIEPAQKCGDGTPYGFCVYDRTKKDSDRPKYCDEGKIVYNCVKCGCPIGYECKSDGDCEEIKYYVFVTYQSYDGDDFGGITGADAKCDSDVNKPEGGEGTYKALISSDGKIPYSTSLGINSAGKIYSGHSGKKIADNYFNFKLGNFENDILDFDFFSEQGLVWTGAVADKDCEDWTSNSLEDKGKVGYADADGSEFWNYEEKSCDNKYKLYCIGQI